MKAIIVTTAIAASALAIAAGWVTAAQQSDLAAAEQRLNDLLQRTERQQDEREIENLQRIYGYYLDRALWDQIADLFADDGTIEIGLRGVYVGKKRIRESLELFGPQGLSDGRLNDHMNLQPVITVAPDGKTARGRTRAFIMNGTHGKGGAWGGGIYENEYVKDNGIWKIKSLRFYTTFASDYDQGWAKSALPAPVASDKIPPDRPPSSTYENYPTFYIPPFHYPNPVTGKPVQYPAASATPAGEKAQ